MNIINIFTLIAYKSVVMRQKTLLSDNFQEAQKTARLTSLCKISIIHSSCYLLGVVCLDKKIHVDHVFMRRVVYIIHISLKKIMF